MKRWGILTILLLLVVSFLFSNPYSEPYEPFEEPNILGFDSLNVRLVGSWPYGPISEITYDTIRDLAFCGSFGGGVYIFDVSDPSDPLKISESIHARGYLRGLYYNDVSQHLFLADWSYLEIWDISDPYNPIKLGSCNPIGRAISDISVSGTYAYIADYATGVRVIDVSSPANPFEAGSYEPGDGVTGISIQDSLAYVVMLSDTGFRILDISNPINPIGIGSLDLTIYEGGISVSGSYAYIVSALPGDPSFLRIVDVSDPINPQLVDSCSTSSDLSKRIFISGNYAYVASIINLCIINIENPSNPYLVSNIGVSCEDVWVSGNYAYIAAMEFFNIFTVEDPVNPLLVGQSDMPEHANDVFVLEPYAYLANGFGGLRIIDISTVENPTEIGYFKRMVYDDAQGVFVCDSLAFVAGGYANYFSTVNITDPSNPILVGECYAQSALSVYVEGSYAYLACTHNRLPGLALIDVSDPSNPFEASWFPTQFFVQDIIVSFPYAYLCAQDLLILDISDPHSPQQIGFFPTVAHGIEVQDSFAYLTDGLQGGNTGFLIVNVSNPSLPWEVGYYNTPGVALNCSGRAPHIYIADGAAGLRVIDVSNPVNPIEVGYYKPGGCNDVFLSGNYACVANGHWGLWIYEFLGASVKEKENSFFYKQNLQLLQNPIKGNFIELILKYDNTKKAKIEIYNILGQRIQSYNFNSLKVGENRLRLNVEGVSPGVYFLKLNGKPVGKVVRI